jgi:lipopolysaccharide/colanic/teichoic acid biosynthesis glycosyltransferase
MKRVLDIAVSLVGLLIASPIICLAMLLVWLGDFKSPLYIAPRVGKGEEIFKMVKLRSMIVNAEASGVDSTGAGDSRITFVGRFIRKFKLDELTQLWNVFKGEMSLVGPRPNVRAETDLYTEEEKRLLTVRPGITDFSSIVFSDEGDILADKPDPDLSYNQLIRPWKSRLGLFYIEKQCFTLDVKLVLFTVIAIMSRSKSLLLVHSELKRLGADQRLLQISKRESNLLPHPPPGMDSIVTSRGDKR